MSVRSALGVGQRVDLLCVWAHQIRYKCTVCGQFLRLEVPNVKCSKCKTTYAHLYDTVYEIRTLDNG